MERVTDSNIRTSRNDLLYRNQPIGRQPKTDRDINQLLKSKFYLLQKEAEQGSSGMLHIQKLNFISELIEEILKSKLWFVRTANEKWYYLAGVLDVPPTALKFEQFELFEQLGIIVFDWGIVEFSARASFIDLLRSVLNEE